MKRNLLIMMVVMVTLSFVACDSALLSLSDKKNVPTLEEMAVPAEGQTSSIASQKEGDVLNDETKWLVESIFQPVIKSFHTFGMDLPSVLSGGDGSRNISADGNFGVDVEDFILKDAEGKELLKLSKFLVEANMGYSFKDFFRDFKVAIERGQLKFNFNADIDLSYDEFDYGKAKSSSIREILENKDGHLGVYLEPKKIEKGYVRGKLLLNVDFSDLKANTNEIIGAIDAYKLKVEELRRLNLAWEDFEKQKTEVLHLLLKTIIDELDGKISIKIGGDFLFGGTLSYTQFTALSKDGERTNVVEKGLILRSEFLLRDANLPLIRIFKKLKENKEDLFSRIKKFDELKGDDLVNAIIDFSFDMARKVLYSSSSKKPILTLDLDAYDASKKQIIDIDLSDENLVKDLIFDKEILFSDYTN